MKKSLLLAALALATFGTATAQTATPAVKTTGSDANQNAMHEKMMAEDGKKASKTPAQKADHKAAKMAKELGLNTDQENKVEQILLAENQEMQALHAKAAGPHGISPAMKAARAKYDGQLKAVLTPDQFAKLQAKRDKHLKEHGGKMKMKD